VHGVNGFLVPAKDAHALADAIEALLRDPELRRAMGAASRALAEERFDERALIARTLELYA
jgi:glycosyltransferase involved in cell wall biosynthesis